MSASHKSADEPKKRPRVSLSSRKFSWRNWRGVATREAGCQVPAATSVRLSGTLFAWRLPLRDSIEGLSRPIHSYASTTSGSVVHGPGKPSAQTALHVVVASIRHVAAVLHTHSVWRS